MQVIGKSGSSSKSTAGSTKGRRVLITGKEHFYSHSPGKYKRKFLSVQQVQVKSRKRLYNAKQRIGNLKRNITSLKTVIEDLRNSCNIPNSAVHHLEKTFEDIPQILMKRHLRNVQNESTTREKYPP